VNRTANAALLLTAGMAILLGGACVLIVDFDAAGWAGAGIGAALGLANLVLGGWLARRSLRRGMQSAMGTLLGGFFVRLLLVAALIVVFSRTEAIDAVAFALVFLFFFFAYIAFEVRLVERASSGSAA